MEQISNSYAVMVLLEILAERNLINEDTFLNIKSHINYGKSHN